MADITIEATGTSNAFTVLGDGFDIGLTMTGSNSVTIERQLGAAWYTVGSAVTSTGTVSVATYEKPAKFRLNCGTFDTADITGFIGGNVIGGPVLIEAA
jgi:hypothetical protein